MLNISTPLYCLSATTASASITLNTNHIANDTLVIVNEGAQAVYVQTGTGAVTAVFPTSSATAFSNGTVILAGQTQEFKKNPTHETIALIRPVGATAANVYIEVGADII